MHRKELEQAIAALQRAVKISPSYADGYALLALIKNNQGEAEEAIKYINMGIELNPFYTLDYQYNLGRAYYALGDFHQAVEHLEQAQERNPLVMQIKIYLAASYVQLEQLDDASWVITDLGIQHPEITVPHLRYVLPLDDESLRQRLFAELHAAGMPEQ